MVPDTMAAIALMSRLHMKADRVADLVMIVVTVAMTMARSMHMEAVTEVYTLAAIGMMSRQDMVADMEHIAMNRQDMVAYRVVDLVVIVVTVAMTMVRSMQMEAVTGA